MALLLCSLHGSAELTADRLNQLREAQPGDVLQLGELVQSRSSLSNVPIRIKDEPGPRFLISDHPEYFRSNGIALQEEVPAGRIRLYVYHVPEPAQPKKIITAVIENLADQSMSLHTVRRGFAPPSRDYPKVVKQVLTEFLDSVPAGKTNTVPRRGSIVLDPVMDQSPAGKDDLVHGFYEFEISQAARISVLQRSQGENSLDVLNNLPKLEVGGRGNGAGRGLFSTCELSVTNSAGFVYDTALGPLRLVVADGKTDPWIRGRDSISGQESRDAGNYGVMYSIRIAWKSTNRRGLALLMTRVGAGSSGCGKVGAAVQIITNGKPQTVHLPKNQTAFGEPGEAVLIYKSAAALDEKTSFIEFVYSPPGAACIPTPFVLLPFDAK
jgi:hypothetical protein